MCLRIYRQITGGPGAHTVSFLYIIVDSVTEPATLLCMIASTVIFPMSYSFIAKLLNPYLIKMSIPIRRCSPQSEFLHDFNALKNSAIQIRMQQIGVLAETKARTCWTCCVRVRSQQQLRLRYRSYHTTKGVLYDEHGPCN